MVLTVTAAAAALTLPAIAQQAAQPADPPATTASPTPAPATSPEPSAEPATSRVSRSSGPDESAVEEVSSLNFAPPPAPVEYPGWARRDVRSVGKLDPQQQGLGAEPWGTASGAFLSTLMRRMETPLGSRWAQIALRDALLAKAEAPRGVNPVDWVAERAWLLLRMGEADAARMLVAAVDVDRFSPKMVQVAVQSALATADPAALCPLQDGMRKHDPAIRPLVQAICSSLAGEPQTASGQIDHARRYGRIGGIDLALAEKVVGAGGGGRAATLEWDAVDHLTAWRFGLATATGVVPPDRLVDRAAPRLRAFQARAPLLSPQQRLPSAFVAAGLGVLSSQSMVDLMSAIYETTGAGDLPNSEAWQLRQAFVAGEPAARLAAVRQLLGLGKGPHGQQGARVLAARAAAMIEPDREFAEDAPELIAAMLAGGYDRAAERWIPIVNSMNDEDADRAWAMLALAAPSVANVGTGRVATFIRRDTSPGRQRSALLVAGLAGLGRISTDTANSLNRRHGLGIGRVTSWTRMIEAAAGRGQAGTVLVLSGTGFQTADLAKLPGSHMYHAISALRRTGQDFTARMIAAEALSRT
ncbi:MAG TPA: hypothetical protein VM308_08885 [Sphingomicrobium sp.]|nr:hypothetical protein [Sphingomicrobium sp.]